jgi:hypothetical protein
MNSVRVSLTLTLLVSPEISEALAAPQSPWQSPHAERLIDSKRMGVFRSKREGLDRVIG